MKMREILFRGKRKNNYEWLYRYNEWLYGFPYITRKNAVKINWYCSDFGSMRTDEVDPETVGQYTGVTDENGVKIFEGDIVQALWARYETKHIYPIEYRNGTYWFGNWNWIEFLDRFQFPEVIGNIYDNPELIEVKR